MYGADNLQEVHNSGTTSFFWLNSFHTFIVLIIFIVTEKEGSKRREKLRKGGRRGRKTKGKEGKERRKQEDTETKQNRKPENKRRQQGKKTERGRKALRPRETPLTLTDDELASLNVSYTRVFWSPPLISQGSRSGLLLRRSLMLQVSFNCESEYEKLMCKANRCLISIWMKAFLGEPWKLVYKCGDWQEVLPQLLPCL